MLHVQNYNYSKHLAIDEVTVLSKGRLHSSRISKKTNLSDLKLINCVTIMAAHGTDVYLLKDKKWAKKDMTANNATVKQMRR